MKILTIVNLHFDDTDHPIPYELTDKAGVGDD
jgi:hypothetical protein